MNEGQTLFDIAKIIGTVTGAVIICYVIKLFVHIILINRTIEKYCRERDDEIEETKHAGGTTAGFQSAKISITERYDKKINPLLRRKGYIFDILPLIPKK